MLSDITSMWNLKTTLNITKKLTHRFREQTSGYQLGEGREEGQHRGRGIIGTNY